MDSKTKWPEGWINSDDPIDGIPRGKMYGIYGSCRNTGISTTLIDIAKKWLEQGKRVYFMNTELAFDNFEERLKQLTKLNSVCSKIPTPKEVEKSILAACEHTTKLIDEAEAEIKRVDEINARVEAEAKATNGMVIRGKDGRPIDGYTIIEMLIIFAIIFMIGMIVWGRHHG